MTVFCLDKYVKEYLIEKYPECEYIIIDNTSSENMIDFQENGWNHVVFYKMKAIYLSLQQYERVLFIDGDIVLYKNPLDHLEKMLELNKKDILFQTDLLPNDLNYVTNYIKKFNSAQQLLDFSNNLEFVRKEANTPVSCILKKLQKQ